MQKKKKRAILFFTLLLIALIIVIANTTKHKPTEQGSSQPQEISQSDDNDTIEVKTSITSTLSDEEIANSQKRGLPVLMYHFFYDKEAGETGRDNNYMEIHDFEEQIKYLSENNYYVPTWDEVLGYINKENGLPEKSVVITVDDGDESFFRLAVPILDKYNFKATSFAITSWYTIPQNQDLHNVDLQSHSHDMHKAGKDGKGAFLTMSYEDACNDLNTSRSILGDSCCVFCYPFGHFNNNCKKVLKDCNYSLAFTTAGGRVFPGSDVYELPRVRMSKGISLNSFISKVK